MRRPLGDTGPKPGRFVARAISRIDQHIDLRIGGRGHLQNDAGEAIQNAGVFRLLKRKRNIAGADACPEMRADGGIDMRYVESAARHL